MAKNPLVSIVIVGNNESDYLDRCYQSILMQTYSNVEIIYVDNDSDDDSYEKSVGYSAAFREKGMYINVLKNKKKYSYSRCVTIGLEKTVGDYLYFIIPQNTLESDFVENLVDRFEDEDVGAVFFSQDKICKNEVVDSRILNPLESMQERLSYEADLWIGQMARRRIYSVIWQKYNVTLEDYKFLYEGFLATCFNEYAIVDKVLVHLEEEMKLEDREKNMMCIFERYLMHLAMVDTCKKIKQENLVKDSLVIMKKIARLCIAKAIRMYSFKENELAKKYLQMSKVYDLEMEHSEIYQKVKDLLEEQMPLNAELIKWCQDEGQLCCT